MGLRVSFPKKWAREGLYEKPTSEVRPTRVRSEGCGFLEE